MLNIATRVLVQNNRALTGTGYVNTLATDGAVSLKFRLFWKTC